MMEFFKANEKVIMVVLLAIIAPSFAFTGLMFNALQSASDPVVLTIHDEDITQTELAAAQRHLARVWLAGQGVPPSRSRPAVSANDVIDHKLALREAKRQGIAVPQEMLTDTIRQIGKRLIAMKDLLDENGDVFPNGSQLQTRIESTSFRKADYRAALRDKRIGFEMSVASFEGLLEESLLSNQLLMTAFLSYPVAESEVFDEYKRQQHKRSFDFVQVKGEDFVEAAKTKAATAEDRLLETFNFSPQKYATKPKVKLEIAQVTNASRGVYEPGEQEMLDYYNNTKDANYKADPPKNADGTVNTDAPIEYKPFADVKSQVMYRVRLQKANQELAKALAEGQRRHTSKEEYQLIDLFGDYAPSVEVYETGWFSVDDLKDLPSDYRSDPMMQGLFQNWDQLAVGDFGNQLVKLPAGDYLYRIAGKQAAVVPTELAACREAVVADLAETLAGELAEEALETWPLRIRDEGATFDALAAEAGYTIHSVEAAGRSETVKVKVNDLPIPAAFSLLSAAFQIEEVGGVSDATLSPLGDAAYITRLTALVEPDTGQYDLRRDSIEAQLRRERREFAVQQYRRQLREGADVRILEPDDPRDVE